MKSYREALSLIRLIPDFPKPGILLQDITPLLSDGEAFTAIISKIATCSPDVDFVAGVEARGFIFAAAVANSLGVGFIPIRKSGKLPTHSISRSYGLEYGNSVLEVHRDAFPQGSRILLIDDILATGGTISASIELIEELDGVILDVAFISEIEELDGYRVIKERYPAIEIHILSR